MKNKDLTINFGDLVAKLKKQLRQLNKYKAFSFFLVAAVLYGFIIWRINVYSNAPASQSEVSAQTTAQPHIDQATIDKIQSLQDNSVSVQSLFDQARQNPFNE